MFFFVFIIISLLLLIYLFAFCYCFDFAFFFVLTAQLTSYLTLTVRTESAGSIFFCYFAIAHATVVTFTGGGNNWYYCCCILYLLLLYFVVVVIFCLVNYISARVGDSTETFILFCFCFFFCIEFYIFAWIIKYICLWETCDIFRMRMSRAKMPRELHSCQSCTYDK